MTLKQRNNILTLAAQRQMSYTLIAKRCGVTRNAVAGVVFRSRHAPATLVRSAGSTARNMTGQGYVRAAYQPVLRVWA